MIFDMKNNKQKRFIENYFMYSIAIIAMLLTVFPMEARSQANSDIQETGRRGRTVYINDLEDHTWTYYSGVDRSVDGGYYNDNYIGKLYSPNPRNVMITYNGVNDVDGSETDVKVSIDDENENSFVYYKTLEQGDAVGEYPYTVISNPFSVRPSKIGADSQKVYYGFNGWKIISGGEYIKGYGNNSILPLDAEIIFEKLPYDTENCISARVVLQTTWTPLNNIVHHNGISTDSYKYIADGGNYETNILVLKSDQGQHIVADSPCTIMMVEPDGSDDYRKKYTFTKLLRPVSGASNRTKIEFVHWKPSGDINARGRNFTIGRGMVMDGAELQALYGTKTDSEGVDQILKIESGIFLKFENYGAKPTNIVKQCVTFGNDYDRAEGENQNLKFAKKMCVAYSNALPSTLDDDSEICRVYSLSGSFVTDEEVGNAEHTSSYYFNVGGSASAEKGYRYLEILGGEWKNIVGGWGPNHPKDTPAFIFRMRGGHILGSIYGAAQYEAACGTCAFVITGGTIEGWVAGGANGTKVDKGELEGESFIYVGGNAIIDSNPNSTAGSSAIINRAVGGNVFGAGCGYSANSTSGQVTLGTNVVIADRAYVERGVYGGGSYGYCKTDQTSNIYITGGTVAGNTGGVYVSGSYTRYDETIQGGVYGGACQNKGGDVNIYMTGGTVNGGIYGGSNASGALSGNVKMIITGGAIGSSQANANVHGGGYGSVTAVNGNVSLVFDKNGDKEAKVYGDVYGGGAEGRVNNDISVNVNAATLKGNLYGGGYGANAVVAGNTQVLMTGGTVGYTETIDGKAVVRGDVFGGGNAAAVTGNTSVTITGGEVKRNVYGGGNKAAVSGVTNVIIGKGL